MLWHIPLSHFNEKVRWALDFKNIPHQRQRVGADYLFMACNWTWYAPNPLPRWKTDPQLDGNYCGAGAAAPRTRAVPKG